jgi:uncharacterized linocin/CFP29 family protein
MKRKGKNYQLKALRLETGLSRKDIDWYRREKKDVPLETIRNAIEQDELSENDQ